MGRAAQLSSGSLIYRPRPLVYAAHVLLKVIAEQGDVLTSSELTQLVSSPDGSMQ